MFENGCILLSRNLIDSEVFASQKMLKIWVWCLIKANYKDRFIDLKIGRGFKTIKVKRGSFIFGRFSAEDELYLDGSTIYKIMRKLQDLGNISIKSNNHYSIVSICNYDRYQNIDNYKVTAKEQQKNSQRQAKEQPSNTDKNVNKDNNILNRENFFKKEIEKFKDKYDIDMLTAFFAYWSEPNKTKTKMRFEMQQTWDIKRRLITWKNNNLKK